MGSLCNAFGLVQVGQWHFVILSSEFCSPNTCLIAVTDLHDYLGERGGSVVECRTPEREVRGSRPTAAVLCPWARHFTPRKYWLITQEAMAPSRHDWKIVDWDVKPQHNQPTWLPVEFNQPIRFMQNDNAHRLLYSRWWIPYTLGKSSNRSPRTFKILANVNKLLK